MTKENDNILNIFQTYSNFYKGQISELETQLISSKMDAANIHADMLV